MKKVFLLIGLILGVFTAKAQTASGDLFIGGAFQFSSSGGEQTTGPTTTESNTSISFTASPRVGYFISDKTAVGASIGYSLNGNTDPDDDFTRSNLIFFQPFARYYVPVSEEINFYGQGAAGINFGGSKRVDDNTETDTGDIFAFNVGLRAGVAIFPAERINIDLGFNILSFSSTRNTNPAIDPAEETTSVTNRFNFGFNSFAPNIAVNYFF